MKLWSKHIELHNHTNLRPWGAHLCRADGHVYVALGVFFAVKKNANKQHTRNSFDWANLQPFSNQKTHQALHYPDPTMMLLIGMKMSLTKNPMKPITINPKAVLMATLENSRRSGLWHRLTKRMLSLAKSFTGLTTVSTASMIQSSTLDPEWCGGPSLAGTRTDNHLYNS